MKYLVRLKWDFLVIGLLVLAALIYSFHDSPWIFRAENPVFPGSRPPDRFVGDILLLTPDSPPDRANQFSELDCSYAWYNALWQRYGSFASAKVSELSPELLVGRLAVIVPESVAAEMSAEGIEALKNATDAGVFTLVEMPTEVWSSFLSLEPKSEIRKANFAALPSGELSLIGTRKAFELEGDFRNHFSVDGAFGFFSKRKGKGRVFGSSFQIGCNLIALQQGLPTKGMRFEKEVIRTSQRSSIPIEKVNKPLADLLENAVFDSLESYRPTPRLWHFPHAYQGAISVIHPRFEYVSSRMQNLETGALMRANFDDATHLADEKNPYCIWSVHHPSTFNARYFNTKHIPVFSELDLETQLRGCKVAIAQDMSWSSKWMSDIAKISGSEILMDMSLGSKSEGPGGYTFGTGFPYYPITRDGLPLPTLLQPILFSDSRQLLELEKFIETSRSFHQMTAISFPTDEMKKRPDGSSLLILSRLKTIAEEKNQWLVSPLDWAHFLSRRRQSILSSQWFEDQQRLVVSINISEGGEEAMAVVLPSEYGGASVESILLDAKPQKLKKLKTIDGFLMLKVEPGRHKIELRFPLQEPLMGPSLNAE